MDFITGTVLSGVLYDMLKQQINLTSDNIKEKLQGWLIDDAMAKNVEVELARLQLSEDMSESAIDKQISSSKGLLTLMREIKPVTQTAIIQAHSGIGDNVAGDKITN